MNTTTNPVSPILGNIDFWLTTSNQTVKLEKQTTQLKFESSSKIVTNIEVNDTYLFQDVEGFGYTLIRSPNFISSVPTKLFSQSGA